MKTVPLAALAALFALGFAASPPLAAPVRWSENGHYYEAVAIAANAEQADALAARSVGYLATIHNGAENEFVYGLLERGEYWIKGHAAPVQPKAWIGGRQQPGAAEPDGGWEWTSGEFFDYSHWRPGEPNNAGQQNEDRIHLGGALGDGWTGIWNDVRGSLALDALVIEWNHFPAWRFGEFDNSGRVDLQDFLILKYNFGTSSTPADGNADFDDLINLDDFLIVKSNFGQRPRLNVESAVPEPCAAALAAVGLACWLVRRGCHAMRPGRRGRAE